MIKLIKYIIFIGILFLSTSVYSQINSISGTIIDKNNEETLIGTRITLSDSILNINVLSDMDGKYKFENIKPGNYTITVKYISYSTLETNVKIGYDNINLDIYLENVDTNIKITPIINNFICIIDLRNYFSF